MRKTKVICTIGPACEDAAILKDMCLAGMNVARLNFSHGTHEEHQQKIDLIKSVREELNYPIALMLDTKGPEYRIGTFENKKITLKDDDTFTFTTRQLVGNESIVSVNYDKLMENLEVGDKILVNNGLVIFEVTELNDTDAKCRVVIGGELSNRKSMNFPGKVMKHDFLSEQDKKDLLFGIKNDVDFVAASFVSTKQDVADMREFLDANGGKDIEIIAKIENRSGVNNIEEICQIANGVMVARGDLGVEIPAMEVPSVQKYLINKCRMLGKRVITATEMLESMIYNPRPTRAELSDIANAVYDGTSAVMLSGETASGKYPVASIKNMVETVEFTEKNINYTNRFRKAEFTMKNNVDAVSHATCSMAIDVKAKCIIVNSLTGQTARMVSRFRCPVDILGLTTSKKGWRKLNLSWGVTPVLCETFESTEEMFANDLVEAGKIFELNSGDNIVFTSGLIDGNTGNTNMIKVERI
ncbi:pyruvate kinase [Falcatimonas sp. MSJ-15]|uniref:pyruvate kinase n=1 Tax=Falcatimonas sp. MSJ-15 TaxID=2841515 RepID=UPI001C108CB9|nr:pyruvate kinase [Falcatimonas sp. MSJ-15]MBU5470969.1 pyruvate kinase [Falcatimonas sp. MSJ-15]